MAAEGLPKLGVIVPAICLRGFSANAAWHSSSERRDSSGSEARLISEPYEHHPLFRLRFEHEHAASPLSRARCRFEFVARLPNYKLCFHKRSKDGSAKCNAFRTAEPTDAVIGVVYEIPTNEKPALDRAEGLGAGYHEEIVPVLSPEGEKVTVHAYIADASFIDDILQPYSWYKNFVLAGAEEHRLPAEYVESRIGAVHAIRDPDPQREQARRAEIKT